MTGPALVKVTTASLWNNNTAYIKTTGPALAKVTTISLWNNNTAYNTMTRSTLAKVTTVSLWKDTAYITTVFLQVRTACQKFIPCVKFAAKQTFAFLLFGGSKRHSSGGARLFKADLFVSVNLQ